jgi:peptide/nickel transport system permease protein
MRRYAWIARRLLLGLVTIFLVSVLVFVATQALPSDPGRTILGRSASPEQVAKLDQQLGFERPVLAQYWSWLTGFVRGDFGESISYQIPARSVVTPRLENSADLLLLTALIVLPVSCTIGVWTATRRDGVLDNTVTVISMILNVLPEFVVGIVLVMVFSTTYLHIFPATSPIPPGESPFAYPEQLVLPVAVLTLVTLPYMIRLVRGSTVDVLESEYVQVARLKGLSSRRVLWAHAVPNSLVPAVQGAAATLAYLAGGIVIVEYLFAYPGIGSTLLTSIEAHDLPVIQASVVFLAAAYVVFNLAADVTTVFLTPRLRTRSR